MFAWMDGGAGYCTDLVVFIARGLDWGETLDGELSLLPVLDGAPWFLKTEDIGKMVLRGGM